ncbi:MAG TPA: MFS transporter [Anaerolineae bacterium]|nr:MFS transporter [Anaerolineae bacterium]
MLHNKQFRYLWLITIATTLGLELFTITILVTIFEQTASTLQTAGTMVARSLPLFLLGPIAGVLVDHFPRKYVLISMDIIRLLLIGLAIWLLQDSQTIPVFTIYLILAALSAADVFHKPARLALIPSLVPPDQLVSANSFIVASTQILLAISYTLGGWLLLTFTLQQISLGVILLFLLTIIIATLITVPPLPQTDDNDPDNALSFWQAFITGWHYLRQHPIARPLTIMETIEHLPHGIWTAALLLAFTTQALNGDSTDWGYQVTAYFTGMIVGSLIALRTSNWLQKYPGRIIAVNAALVGFLTLAYSQTPNIPIAIIICILFGPPFAIRDVAQDSLLQATVTDKQLGRVYATREMLRSAVFMFAGLFFAWLSDQIPIRYVYIIGGTIYLLTALYAFTNKQLLASHMPHQASS